MKTYKCNPGAVPEIALAIIPFSQDLQLIDLIILYVGADRYIWLHEHILCIVLEQRWPEK